MNLDLTSLFPDLEALTPDGRWTLLQEWLRENPKYAKKVDRWINQSPDEIFTQLCQEEFKMSPRIIQAVIGIEMVNKIKRAIETMQACYRERANGDVHAHSDQSISHRRKRKHHVKNTKTKTN